MRTRRRDFKYWKTYPTRWSDNDQYSHINNAVYYHLIDSIVNTFLAERCGCIPSSSTPATSQADIPETLPPIGLVVSSRCDFFSPLSFPETVEVGLRVVQLGTSSVTYEVGFFSASDPEELKAVGGYTHVFVDRINRRPVKAMGEVLRQGLLTLVGGDDSELGGQKGRSSAKL